VIAHHHQSKVYTDLQVRSPWGRLRAGEGLDPARFAIKLWREIDDTYLLALSRSNQDRKCRQKSRAKQFLATMKELGHCTGLCCTPGRMPYR
jgi:hypothetical protein